MPIPGFDIPPGIATALTVVHPLSNFIPNEPIIPPTRSSATDPPSRSLACSSGYTTRLSADLVSVGLSNIGEAASVGGLFHFRAFAEL
jgi:hypothetical protein